MADPKKISKKIGKDQKPGKKNQKRMKKSQALFHN